MADTNINVIKHFSPAWFAMVMGTGGLANVMYALGKTFPTAKPKSKMKNNLLNQGVTRSRTLNLYYLHESFQHIT